jgi:hypothetical protein
MEIPFTFSEAVVPDAIAVSIEAPGNVRWSQGWMGGYPNDSTMSYRHVLFFERDFYRRVASRTVTLRASMYLRLQNQTRLPLPAGRATRIPGGAFCAISTVDKADVVFCRSPFRSLYDAVRGSDAATHELLSIWYSPWPAEFALSPVFTDSFSCAAGSTVSFVREDPLGWVRRDLRATVQLPPLPPEVQP